MIEIKKTIYPAYSDQWGSRPEVTLWHVLVNGIRERNFHTPDEARAYVIKRYGRELYDRDVRGRFHD